MHKISKRVVFSAAHSIKGAGKCENKHGHNWVATIEVTSDQLDDKGFICDIALMKQAAFKYDHDDLDKYFEFPSTELVCDKIASDVFDIVRSNLPSGAFIDVHVHLVETENNNADAWASTLAQIPNAPLI